MYQLRTKNKTEINFIRFVQKGQINTYRNFFHVEFSPSCEKHKNAYSLV